MGELKKASIFFENNDLEKSLDIVDILIGSGTLFPDTYVLSLILRSKIMNTKSTDVAKSYELALEAETIATVEDNTSLIIDSKLAIIENLLVQNKLTTIPEKLQEVTELLESFDNSDGSKQHKLETFTTIQSRYNSFNG